MEGIKQKMLYVGNDTQFVSNATTNYVVLEKERLLEIAKRSFIKH